MERYTPQAKEALSLAVEMAESLNHGYVGTEHLLIGLLQEGTGVAAKVLEENGVEEAKVVELVSQLITPDNSVQMAENAAYTPRARRVIENSYREAVRFKAAHGDYGMLVLPMTMEGTGILYNTKILEETGWDHMPETRDELLQYCKDLKEKGIQPFMLPWAETYLNLFNNVGNYWLLDKPDGGKETLAKLMNGEDVDLANDPEMTELLDTYEQILMPYAQEGAVSADKWTCRNAFFAEECAMLIGEGSYETPNIQNANPALLDHVKQGILPISNDASKNKMAIATISISVTKNDDPNVVACAKDFASWLVSSDTARLWHQETMGSPTSIQGLEVSDKLPVIAKDVIDTIDAGKATENVFVYMPSSIYTDMQENWAKYVAGVETREQFLERYQQIFKDLKDGIYG